MAELPRFRFASAPLFTLGAAAVAGILSDAYFSSSSVKRFSIVALASVLSAIASVRFSTKHPEGAALLIIIAFVSAGIGLGSLDCLAKGENRISRLYDTGAIAVSEPVEMTGAIEGQPEPAPDSFYLILQAKRLVLKGVEREVQGTVLLRANGYDQQVRGEYNALDLHHGAVIRVMTILDREENFRNPGVLSFREYLERKGLDATGLIKSPLLIDRLDDETVFLPLAWLYQWRELLHKEFSRLFSPETAGILEAAVLGNRYNLSQGAADRFRTGGTFHILVISGLHIAFIGGLVFFLVRWFTRCRFLQFLMSAMFLWAYTIAVGAQAPVVRAALMFSLVVFAPLVWRKANSRNVIGGAMLALLMWRPQDLFDPSLQLTFMSVLSIVLIAAPLLRRMEAVGSWRPTHTTPYPPSCRQWFRNISEILFWSEREWRAEAEDSNVQYRVFKHCFATKLERWRCQRLLRSAAAAIVVSASVQVGMLPLLIIYFHRISFASLLLNILIGALLAIVAFLALAAVLISYLSASLASPLIAVVERIDWLMIHLVDPFTRAGIAAMRLPHYSGWKAVLYVVYFSVLAFLMIALARWSPFQLDSVAAPKPGIFNRRAMRWASGMFLVISSTVVLHPVSADPPDGKLHVDFLDVGQGDSALLTMPDGTTLLIDGGGRPNIDWSGSDDANDEPFEPDRRSIGEAVVSEYLWSRGLDRVDYLLATHADADHIDGLNHIAHNFKVRGAIVARTPPDDAEYSRFSETMRDVGVPVERIGAGDVMRFGNVTADVLWPLASADTCGPYNNNDGLVLRIHYGDKSFLFLADIEKQTEAILLKLDRGLQTDIVKVAHHGSKTSSTEEFVSATKSQYAIISVGRTSPFGHPNREVVERWRASGAQVMTTGDKGTISVLTDGRTVSISTFVP